MLSSSYRKSSRAFLLKKILCYFLIINHIWLGCAQATNSVISDLDTQADEKAWNHLAKIRVQITPENFLNEKQGFRLQAWQTKLSKNVKELEDSDKGTMLESEQLVNLPLIYTGLKDTLPELCTQKGLHCTIGGLKLFIGWNGKVWVNGGEADSISLETPRSLVFTQPVKVKGLTLKASHCTIQSELDVEEELEIGLSDPLKGLSIQQERDGRKGILSVQNMTLHEGHLKILYGGTLILKDKALLDLNDNNLLNNSLLEALGDASIKNAGLIDNTFHLFAPKGHLSLQAQELKNHGARIEGQNLSLNVQTLKNQSIYRPYGVDSPGVIMATENLAIEGEGTAVNQGTFQGNMVAIQNKTLTNHHLIQSSQDLKLAPQETFTNEKNGWVKIEGKGTVSGSGTIVNAGGRIDLDDPLAEEHRALEGAGMTFQNLLFDQFKGTLNNEGAWMVRDKVTGVLTQFTNNGLWKAANSLLTLEHFENLPGAALKGSGILGNGKWTITKAGVNRHIMKGDDLEIVIQNKFQQTETGLLQGNNRLNLTGTGTADLMGQMVSDQPILLDMAKLYTPGNLKTSPIKTGEKVEQWTIQDKAKLESKGIELASPRLIFKNDGEITADSLKGNIKEFINEKLSQVKDFFLKAGRLWNSDTLRVAGKSELTLQALQNEGDLEFKGGVTAQVNKTDHTGTMSFGKNSVYMGQTFLKKGQINVAEGVALDLNMTQEMDIHKEMDVLGTINLLAPHLNTSPNSKIKAQRKLSMEAVDDKGALHPLFLKGKTEGKEQFNIKASKLKNTGEMLSPQNTLLHTPEGFTNEKKARLRHLDLTLNDGRTLHNTPTGEMILSSPVKLGKDLQLLNQGLMQMGKLESLIKKPGILTHHHPLNQEDEERLKKLNQDKYRQEVIQRAQKRSKIEEMTSRDEYDWYYIAKMLLPHVQGGNPAFKDYDTFVTHSGISYRPGADLQAYMQHPYWQAWPNLPKYQLPMHLALAEKHKEDVQSLSQKFMRQERWFSDIQKPFQQNGKESVYKGFNYNINVPLSPLELEACQGKTVCVLSSLKTDTPGICRVQVVAFKGKVVTGCIQSDALPKDQSGYLFTALHFDFKDYNSVLVRPLMVGGKQDATISAWTYSTWITDIPISKQEASQVKVAVNSKNTASFVFPDSPLIYPYFSKDRTTTESFLPRTMKLSPSAITTSDWARKNFVGTNKIPDSHHHIVESTVYVINHALRKILQDCSTGHKWDKKAAYSLIRNMTRQHLKRTNSESLEKVSSLKGMNYVTRYMLPEIISYNLNEMQKKPEDHKLFDPQTLKDWAKTDWTEYPSFFGHFFQNITNEGELLLAGEPYQVNGTLLNKKNAMLIHQSGAELLYKDLVNEGRVIAPHGMELFSLNPKHPLLLKGIWDIRGKFTLQSPELEVMGKIHAPSGSTLTGNRMTLHSGSLWQSTGADHHFWHLQQSFKNDGEILLAGSLGIRSPKIDLLGEIQALKGSSILGQEMTIHSKGIFKDGGDKTLWNLSDLFRNDGKMEMNHWHLMTGKQGYHYGSLILGGNARLEGQNFYHKGKTWGNGSFQGIMTKEFDQVGEMTLAGNISLSAPIVLDSPTSKTRAGGELALKTSHPLTGYWEGTKHFSWTEQYSPTYPTLKSSGTLVSPHTTSFYAGHGLLNEGKAILSGLHLYISPGNYLTNTKTGMMEIHNPVSLGYDFNILNQGDLKAGILSPLPKNSSYLVFDPKEDVYGKGYKEWVEGKAPWHMLRRITNEGNLLLTDSGRYWKLGDTVVNAPAKIWQVGGGLLLRSKGVPKNQGIFKFLTDGEVEAHIPLAFTGEWQGLKALSFIAHALDNSVGKVRSKGILSLTSTQGDILVGHAQKVMRPVRELNSSGYQHISYWSQSGKWVSKSKDKPRSYPYTITGAGSLTNGECTYQHFTNNDALFQSGTGIKVSAKGKLLNLFGLMHSQGFMTLKADKEIDNYSGIIQSQGDILFQTPHLQNRLSDVLIDRISDYVVRFDGDEGGGYIRWQHPASDPALIASTGGNLLFKINSGRNHGSRILGAKNVLFEQGGKTSSTHSSFKATSGFMSKNLVNYRGNNRYSQTYTAWDGYYPSLIHGGNTVQVVMPGVSWSQEGMMNAPVIQLHLNNFDLNAHMERIGIQKHSVPDTKVRPFTQTLIINLGEMFPPSVVKALKDGGGLFKPSSSVVPKDQIVRVRQPGTLSPKNDLPFYLSHEALQGSLMQALSSIAGTLNITKEFDLEGQMRALHRQAKDKSGKGQEIVLKDQDLKELKKSFIGYVSKQIGDVQTLVAHLYLSPQDVETRNLKLASLTGDKVAVHTEEAMDIMGSIYGEHQVMLTGTQIRIERPEIRFKKEVDFTTKNGGIWGSSKTTKQILEYVLPGHGGDVETGKEGRIGIEGDHIGFKGAQIKAGIKGLDIHAKKSLVDQPFISVDHIAYDISETGTFGGSYSESGFVKKEEIHPSEFNSLGSVKMVSKGSALLQASQITAETGEGLIQAKNDLMFPSVKVTQEDIPKLSSNGTKIEKTIGSKEIGEIARIKANKVIIESLEGKISGVRPNILSKDPQIRARSIELMEEQEFRNILQRTQKTFVVGSTVDPGLMLVMDAALTVACPGLGIVESHFLSSMIFNKGNLGDALREATSKDALKSLGTKVASALIMQAMNLNAPVGGEFMDHLSYQMQKSLIETGTKAVIYQDNIEDALKEALTQGLINSIASYGAQSIGKAFDTGKGAGNYLLHKTAHGLLGAAKGYAQNKSKEGGLSGALGAVVAEVVAEQMTDRSEVKLGVEKQALEEGWWHDTDRINRTFRDKLQPTLDKTKLVAGMIALASGQNVDIALQTAANALEHNYAQFAWGAILTGGTAAWTAYDVYTTYQNEGEEAALQKLAIDGAIGMITYGTGKIAYKVGSNLYPSAQAAWSAYVAEAPLLMKMIEGGSHQLGKIKEQIGKGYNKIKDKILDGERRELPKLSEEAKQKMLGGQKKLEDLGQKPDTIKALDLAENKGLGSNPFQGKTPQQIDKMLREKGFEPRGADPINGKGGYVNPQTGRSYHIDEMNRYNEFPHVDVNRLRTYKGDLEKKKFPMELEGKHDIDY